MTKEATFPVKAVNDKKNKDWFGIMDPDENWYNDNGSTDLQKGDVVQIKYKEEDGSKSIQSLTMLESGGQSKDEATREDESPMAKEDTGGEKSARSHYNKNRSILAQKALEEARKKHQEENFDSEGEYMEQLTSTADGFFNWMEEKAKEGRRE